MVNAKHGQRIHKRLWNGAWVGFKKGQFQFIGRYGKGPIKLINTKSVLVFQPLIHLDPTIFLSLSIQVSKWVGTMFEDKPHRPCS